LWRPSITAHIFIDPSPDPEKTSPSAKRLFRPAALELAGLRQGAESRKAAASIRAPSRRSTCRPQAQAALGFAQPMATPQEVLRAILKAPVDLLFFGGIGTYVRSAQEGDRRGRRPRQTTRSGSPAPICAAGGGRGAISA